MARLVTVVDDVLGPSFLYSLGGEIGLEGWRERGQGRRAVRGPSASRDGGTRGLLSPDSSDGIVATPNPHPRVRDDPYQGLSSLLTP